MGILAVQHIYHSTSGLPEDDVVNTVHFASDAAGMSTTNCDALAGHVLACFTDALAAVGVDGATAARYLETMLSPNLSRTNLPTAKVYDAVDPGPPLSVQTSLSMRAADGAAVAFPNEVALCVSYRTEDGDYSSFSEYAADGADPGTEPDRPRSSRRNRLFIGPWNSLGGTVRPSPEAKAALIDLINHLMTIPVDIYDNYTFVGYSPKTGQDWSPGIIWVDDAWDTQRRRGLAPTSRVVTAPHAKNT